MGKYIIFAVIVHFCEFTKKKIFAITMMYVDYL